MANVTPVPRGQLPELEDYFEYIDEYAGYVPNSFLAWPAILTCFGAIRPFRPRSAGIDSVDPGLMVLMRHLASSSFGCRFCVVHTTNTAVRGGVDEEKIAKVWESRAVRRSGRGTRS